MMSTSLAHAAVLEIPADSEVKYSPGRAADMIGRAIDEGRAVLEGLRSPALGSNSPERAFTDLLNEIVNSQGS